MSRNTAQTVLVINPGSTSTELALFGPAHLVWQETIRHSSAELAHEVIDQLRLRKQALWQVLEQRGVDGLAAVVGRGGPLRPLRGGTYRINDHMVADLSQAKFANHASNLGALLAREVARQSDLPAFIVDPVTTDEFDAESRISGVPGIERRCRSHALNIKAAARKAIAELGIQINGSRLVVAHLGGGISVAAVRNGRIVDVNDALLGMGPFSPERAGAIPLEPLIDLAFSGNHTSASLKHLLSRESGLKGYLGTNDLPEVLQRVQAVDDDAILIYRAMIRQIAKEIGAMATVVGAPVQAIVLTGGMANSRQLCSALIERVRFIGPSKVFPGSMELEALAAGAWRVLNGEEEPRDYV